LDEGHADGVSAGDCDAGLDVGGSSADFDGVSSAFVKHFQEKVEHMPSFLSKEVHSKM
jgi:hypothetical protein